MIQKSTKNLHRNYAGLPGTLALAILALLFSGLQTSFAQVVYNEGFEGTTVMPIGWSQQQYGVGTDPDNYWDRVTNTATQPTATPHGGTYMARYRANVTNSGEAAYYSTKRMDMRAMPSVNKANVGIAIGSNQLNCTTPGVAGLFVGMGISAPASVAGRMVTSIVGSTVYLDGNATASSTSTVTFGGALFNFWMYRGGNNTNNDRLQVYVNDSSIVTGGTNGATLLTETVTGVNTINRKETLSPVTTAGWKQYFYVVPRMGNYFGSSVYILFLGTSALGQNIYIDDISINTYPNNQTFTSADVFYQNIAPTSVGLTNQMVIGCKLTMNGAANPMTLTNMEFNTNGSTSPNPDISNAKLWYSGCISSFATGTSIQVGGTIANPWATNFNFPLSMGVENGDNYFWITYDIAPGAVVGHFVDAEWIGLDLSCCPTKVPTTIAVTGSREIDAAYGNPPTYVVGTSWLGYVTNDYVANVKLVGDNIPPGGINNSWNFIYSPAGSACGGAMPRLCAWQSHPPDYELFPDTSTKTTQLTASGSGTACGGPGPGGNCYSITLKVGTYASSNYIAAWIDYNRNGKFTDPGERLVQSGSLAANGTVTVTFAVPTTAVPGRTRLRVREVWLNSNISPTARYWYGETEDYIVTVVPDCPINPNYTTWMGFTNDWTDPNNWCPRVAPLAVNPLVNVLIPGGQSPSLPVYQYYRPKIKSGTDALARTLRIADNDTVYVDAPTGSKMVITDSLMLVNTKSVLRVNTTYVDSAQVSNGTLNRPFDSPLNAATRERTFVLYSGAELAALGIQQGDRIDSLKFHIQRKSNGQPYRNMNISYYVVNTSILPISGGFPTMPLATLVGTPAAPVTVFSGDVNASAFVPVLDNYGTITVPLIPGAMTLTSAHQFWTNPNYRLLIEMCYDNFGSPTTGANDEIRFTQTQSSRQFMTIRAVSSYPKPGCQIEPRDSVRIPLLQGTDGSNVVTVVSGNMANIYPGMIVTAQGSGGFMYSVEGYTVVTVGPGNQLTLDFPAVDDFTEPVTLLNATFNAAAMIYRPNITFIFSRPYIRYPISVAGKWVNNGLFVPAVSRVTLNSTTTQTIEGNSITSFYDLAIGTVSPSTTPMVTMNQDVIVTDSLQLAQGRLKLNNKLLTVTNNIPAAISRTNGFIQPETDVTAGNVSPYGRVNWQMGTNTGIHILPFVNSTGTYIPMEYTPVGGTNDMTFGTYATTAANVNIPGPVVTNIFGFNPTTGWSADGSYMVDRYFMIQKNAGAIDPHADFKFRFALSEKAQYGHPSMHGQKWMMFTTPYPMWDSLSYLMVGQNYNEAGLELTYTDFSQFDPINWWTIVGVSTPLPVSLLDFTAMPYKDKVRLKWTTASEVNSSHFVVERTVNNDDFAFIGRVESKGTPYSDKNEYYLWDNKPVEGIQYYYLRQYDKDGRMESYGPVSAKFSKNLFNIITATVSSTNSGITLVYNYDSNEPVSYRIMDMAGRVIVAQDRNAAEPGVNVLDINASLARGAYQIILQNSDKVVSHKFFY